jgi:hypothetical protein
LSACQRRETGQVLGLEHHAGRALQVQRFGTGQRPFDRRGVASIDEIDLDLEARQHGREQPEGIRIAVAHAQHALASSEIAQHGGADRRHAGGERARRLGAFERGHLGLERLDRRVIAARVDRPPGALGHGVLELLIGAEGEQRGLEDRRHHGAGRESLVVDDDGRGVE